jgi:plastocyanin
MNTFGLSAPAEKIYEHFGFGPDNLTARARDVITFYTPAGTPHAVAATAVRPCAAAGRDSAYPA